MENAPASQSNEITRRGAPHVDTVARELGVRFVVSGGAEASVGGLRVEATLIDTATGQRLWTGGCDLRTTSRSMRFAGRRVYLAMVLMLVSPPGSASAQALRDRLCIAPVTLKRWRQWWPRNLPLTRFWQSVLERFMAPVTITRLPQSLLERVEASTMTNRLAQLLRLGILPRAYIYPKAERGVRDLARKRMQLIRNRTQHILSVQNILARERAQTMNALLIEQLDATAIKALCLAPEVALALSSTVAVIQTLCKQIATVEKRLASCVRSRPQYALLTSVPGIGATLATVIVLETGSIERSASATDFASYARCVTSLRVSNGRKKG
jgi:hypothetical protein